MSATLNDRVDRLVVETSGLTKTFGDRVALDSADLRVPAGVAFGFLGPNGAGKTTLIRVLLGLTPATHGEMRLLGMPVPEQRGEALKRVGAIVEEPSFHGHLTGRENLRIAAACREPEAHSRIQGSLDRVGLTERADERVKAYSMGMRQRLGIARCLLADPELLILDEPTNGLDPAGIIEFREFVRSLVDDGRTVFLSSHLLDEVEKICDMAAIVDRGKILMQGTVAEMAAGGQPTITLGLNDAITGRAPAARPPRGGRVGRGRGGPATRPLRRLGRRRRRHQPPARRGRHRRPPHRAGPGHPGGAVPRGHLPLRGVRMNGRMISAELLRVRKNRALVIWMFLMTVGAVAAFFLIAEGFHLNNAHQNGPPGGATNLVNGVRVISFIGAVAAAILGCTVGTSDLSSGVFRDLVVTGKARVALFGARVPGMLLFWIPLILLAYAVAVVFDFAFAGNLATPGALADRQGRPVGGHGHLDRALHIDGRRRADRIPRDRDRRAARVAAGRHAASAQHQPARRHPRGHPDALPPPESRPSRVRAGPAGTPPRPCTCPSSRPSSSSSRGS